MILETLHKVLINDFPISIFLVLNLNYARIARSVRMKFSILVAFLFVLAVANAYPSNSVSSSEPQRKTRSWFGSLKKIVTKFARKIYYWKDKCHGLECPDYELKKKTDNYELRCYSNYSWVGTQYVGKFALPQRSA